MFFTLPPFSFLASLYLAITLSKLAIAEEAKGPTPSVQTTEAQLGIPQTTQRPESLPFPEGGDTIMGEALEMTALNPSSGLPAFLTRFDSLEFNSLPVSHFHHFWATFCQLLAILYAC